MLVLDLLSLPLIDSATHGVDGHYYAKKQAALVLASLIIMALGAFADYRDFVNLSPWIYGGSCVLLVLVLIVGQEVNGATRWISLGVFPLQPSELAKLAVILFYAGFLSRWEDPPSSYRDILLAYGWILVPAALIMKQPDLGSALTLVAAATGCTYMSGTPGDKMAKLAAAFLVLVVGSVLLHVYAGLPLPLADYQVKRLVSLFSAHEDPLGTGYQVLQSKIAIGSGALWGKGLGKGTQNRLDFIPEQHTDFIFSVVGEELGFVKTVLVLGVYVLLMYRCLVAATTSPDRKGTLVAGGVLSLFLFHVLVNVGMTMGIMPVTGVPLPFLSHGGSALLVDSFMVGMVLNVGWKRHKIFF